MGFLMPSASSREERRRREPHMEVHLPPTLLEYALMNDGESVRTWPIAANRLRRERRERERRVTFRERLPGNKGKWSQLRGPRRCDSGGSPVPPRRLPPNLLFVAVDCSFPKYLMLSEAAAVYVARALGNEVRPDEDLPLAPTYCMLPEGVFRIGPEGMQDVRWPGDGVGGLYEFARLEEWFDHLIKSQPPQRRQDRLLLRHLAQPCWRQLRGAGW